ncbi:hypothetical protein pb186bvf_020742 [Paramecium bursaria]
MEKYITVLNEIVSLKSFPYSSLGQVILNTSISAQIQVNNIILNSIYNIEVYCQAQNGLFSTPRTKNLFQTVQNGAKNMVIKLYSNQILNQIQVKSIACSTATYIGTNNFIVVFQNIQSNCSSTSTFTISQMQNLTTNLLSLYILKDNTQILDNIPSQINLLDLSAFSSSLMSSALVALNNQTSLTDMSTYNIMPILVINSIKFMNQILYVNVQVNNIDSIMCVGVTDLFTTPSVLDQTSFIQFSQVQLQKGQNVTFSFSNLIISKEYLVNIQALTAMSLETPNTGLIRKPIIASRQEDEFDGLTIEKVQGLRRSQLQTHDIHEWLKTRHNSKVKKRYLFMPEQIRQQLEVKKIFQNFDRDHSNFLDMGELYDMFQKNGFQISEEQLQRFFNIVDEDKDNKLNWQEFKKTAFNEKAAKAFYNIMKSLRQERKQDTPADKYMPLSFNAMISYLSFLASREELQQDIDKDQLTYLQKFQRYQDMLKLTQQFSNQKRNESAPDTYSIKEETNISNEEKFIKKQESQINLFRQTFMKHSKNSLSKSPSRALRDSPSPSVQKIPRKLREIDAIVRQHETPIKSFFAQRDESSSIIRLKHDVNKYIQLAKTNYNINVEDIKGEKKQKQPLKIVIKSFEDEYKQSLAQYMGHVDTEPYLKVQQHQDLPVIEEKSKTLNLANDSVPAILIKELKKKDPVLHPTTAVTLKQILSKTQSDFTKTSVSTKNSYKRTTELPFKSVPQTAKIFIQRSGITTPNYMRNQSQSGIKIKPAIQPLMGKSLLK